MRHLSLIKPLVIPGMDSNIRHGLCKYWEIQTQDTHHDFIASIFKVNLLFLHIFMVKEVLGIVKPMFTVNTVVAFTVLIITLQQTPIERKSSPLRNLNGE